MDPVYLQFFKNILFQKCSNSLIISSSHFSASNHPQVAKLYYCVNNFSKGVAARRINSVLKKIPFKSYFCWKTLFVFYVAVVYWGLFFFFHCCICKIQTCRTVPCGEQSAKPRLFCLSSRFPYTSLWVWDFFDLCRLCSFKGMYDCRSLYLPKWFLIKYWGRIRGQILLESKRLVLQRRTFLFFLLCNLFMERACKQEATQSNLTLEAFWWCPRWCWMVSEWCHPKCVMQILIW